MTLKLYDFWRSSSAWRVRIGLHHKGLAFEQIPVDLFAAEQDEPSFGAVNPLTQVPVLELEHQGKRVRITQSMAILMLLEQLYPSEPLLPSDPIVRARCVQLAEIVNAGIQPLQNRSVLLRITEGGGDGEAFAQHFISRGLTALERAVQRTAGTFSVGDSVTLADLYLIPELGVARRMGVPVDPLHTLLRIEQACLSTDAFIRADPSAQPDAPAPEPSG
jgi:maleylpyruvate isomerase